MNLPKDERNPKEPKEKGRTGGQGPFWKIEEMCKSVPSPPHEMTNCASFNSFSVSSFKNDKFGTLLWYLKRLEGKRVWRAGAASNCALGKYFWNHLRTNKNQCSVVALLYNMSDPTYSWIAWMFAGEKNDRILSQKGLYRHFSLIPCPQGSQKMEQFPPSSPFASFKISNQEPLRRAESGSRSTCPTCKRSSKYFCYRCVRMIGELDEPGMIPQVKLPINMKM